MSEIALPSRRYILAGLASTTLASCSSLSRAPSLLKPETRTVSVITDAGTIGVQLANLAAPKTTSFFLDAVDAGHFNGRRFWRSGHLRGDDRRGLFIEGGPLDEYMLGERESLPETMATTGLPTLQDWETTGASGLDCSRGSVFLARDLFGDGSAIPEIVIANVDLPEFEEGGGRSPDNKGYPVFGRVEFGMDSVDHISSQPRRENGPVPMLAGQILVEPPLIQKIVRAQT